MICARNRLGLCTQMEVHMIREYQLTIGDICGDRTGLRVKVEDVDIYDRVHFSVIEPSTIAMEEDDMEPEDMSYEETGGMFYAEFIHSFILLGQGLTLWV